MLIHKTGCTVIGFKHCLDIHKAVYRIRSGRMFELLMIPVSVADQYSYSYLLLTPIVSKVDESNYLSWFKSDRQKAYYVTLSSTQLGSNICSI